MPTDNSEQIAEWNGALGQRWVAMQREIDRIVVPFGDAALKIAAPQPGERVIDIGCGCGDTSLDIARIVGRAGAVLGIDVSTPMLEVARSRAALADCANVVFREGDASEAVLPANTDLLFSRFGVMFFSQPTQALNHLRGSLRAGGRCVFVCWRAPRDNAWAMVPLSAARGDGCHSSACGSERAGSVRIRRRAKIACHPVGRGLWCCGCAALRRGALPWRDPALRS
jgi:SAM-dependent methyltransferase